MALRLTTLEAVNQMLSCIGGQAVVSLNTDNPEVAVAVAILEETTRNVLAEGWNFNMEQEYPFTPNTANQIVIPSNLLSFTPSFTKHYADLQLVERKGKFYDKLNHTYTFTDTIYCDVTWGFDFVDCPPPFKEYITVRASRQYAARLVTSKEQVELISQDEAVCRANCIAYDTETARPTMYGIHTGQKGYISFIPFDSLAR